MIDRLRDSEIVEYVEKTYGAKMARRVDWILRADDNNFSRSVRASLLREMESE